MKEEHARISEWIASEKGRLAIESDVENKWNKYQEDFTQPFDHKRVFRKLLKRIHARQGQRVVHRYLRYAMETAAALLVTFSVSLFFKEKEVANRAVPQVVEIYNPKGVRTTVTLPDSSKVILNADSKILYTNKFEGKTRSVTLTGEAYFEVAKDRSRPFIVHAHAATLTVVGTTFNVRSYPEDERTEATLIEGVLKVNGAQLAPGNQIIIDRNSKASTLHQEVNTQNITGWTKGELYFHSMTFAQIASILGRKFSVHINIANASLQEKVLNGKFTHEENLEQILNVIQKTIHFTRRYDPESNILIIE